MKRYRLYYWYEGRLHKVTDEMDIDKWGSHGTHICFDTKEDAELEAELYADKYKVEIAIVDYEAQIRGKGTGTGGYCYFNRMIKLVQPKNIEDNA